MAAMIDGITNGIVRTARIRPVPRHLYLPSCHAIGKPIAIVAIVERIACRNVNPTEPCERWFASIEENQRTGSKPATQTNLSSARNSGIKIIDENIKTESLSPMFFTTSPQRTAAFQSEIQSSISTAIVLIETSAEVVGTME